MSTDIPICCLVLSICCKTCVECFDEPQPKKSDSYQKLNHFDEYSGCEERPKVPEPEQNMRRTNVEGVHARHEN